MKPGNTEEMKIDAYVDADFAGLWGHEERDDPTSVKSRTGFVIFISNCPVLWNSKLQPEIATSTMEAEYNALSLSMREIIPLREVCREIDRNIGTECIILMKFNFNQNCGLQHFVGLIFYHL